MDAYPRVNLKVLFFPIKKASKEKVNTVGPASIFLIYKVHPLKFQPDEQLESMDV